MRPVALLVVLFLLLASAHQALGVGLPAGTTFQIAAQATYTEAGDELRVSPPAVAVLTVLQVAAVAIESGLSLSETVPGEAAYIPLNIRNTGNGPDMFDLSVSSANGWNVSLIYDDNADGVHQQTEEWTITSAGMMVADGYSPCFAKVLVPPGTSCGDTMTVQAVSAFSAIQATVEEQLILGPPDPLMVTITGPTADPAYVTNNTTVDLGGTASGISTTANVSWSTDRGASGSCVGTTNWFAANVPLETGVNVITVTATDTFERTAVDTLSVTFEDIGIPTAVITTPTSNPTYSTSQPELDIAGSASDDVEVTEVTWSNDRGGFGECTGTTSWNATGIALAPGENVISVSAADGAGGAHTDVLTVTYTPDTFPPSVQITSPTGESTYATNDSVLNLSGSASDDVEVTAVTWSNDQGDSGTCTGTSSWAAAGISLSLGQNVITVAASDPSEKTGTDTISVTYTGSDAPVVEITSPTASSTYSTQDIVLSIGGTAAHDFGIVKVSWANNRGGAGTCTDTTSWTAAGITLWSGQNIITVTARDPGGNTATDTLAVTCTAPTVQITSPTTSGAYATTLPALDIAGSAFFESGVSAVNWSNAQGGSGDCTGTTSWSAAQITLHPGQNLITVTASNPVGDTVTDVLNVIYTVDTTNPGILITSPTDEPTCARNCPGLRLGGIASDNTAVTDITWSNAATGDAGTCTIDGATWSSSGIGLSLGDNAIFVTARDGAGNSAEAAVVVTYVDVTPEDAWVGLAMVSLPIIPDDIDPKNVAGFYGNEWSTYLPDANAYVGYPDELTWFEPTYMTPGRGFWAYFYPSGAVPYGTIPPQDQPAAIHLERGWNLVGQPFVSPVVWDLSLLMVREPGEDAKTLAESADVTPGFAWGWRQNPDNPAQGSYYLVYDSSLAPEVDGTLEPWRAYWIKAYKECYLILPAPGAGGAD